MRIRREPLALADDLLPEVLQVLLGEAPFEIRPRIDAGRRVALEVHEVAAVLGRRRAPEMIEPDLIQGRARRVARDVAAVLRADAIRLDDHGHRVPAQVSLDPAVDRTVAGARGVLT